MKTEDIQVDRKKSLEEPGLRWGNPSNIHWHKLWHIFNTIIILLKMFFIFFYVVFFLMFLDMAVEI